MIGTSSAWKSMLFFYEELTLFQQFCCSVVGGDQQARALFASELQLSTRFPLHCQDRFVILLKWGSENEVENSVETVVPKGPKWTPKVDQNRQKGCSGGVPKRDLKQVPSPGRGKVRFCSYLLHFSKVRGLRKGSFLCTVLESILETKS